MTAALGTERSRCIPIPPYRPLRVTPYAQTLTVSIDYPVEGEGENEGRENERENER